MQTSRGFFKVDKMYMYLLNCIESHLVVCHNKHIEMHIFTVYSEDIKTLTGKHNEMPPSRIVTNITTMKLGWRQGGGRKR